MSRVKVKTISTKLEKFIPPSHATDATLSESAKEIAERPLIALWKKLTREDRYNLASLVESKTVDEELSVTNLGTVARYVWENNVIELQNVLLEDEALEAVKGEEKNRLFNTSGMDTEIAEIIRHVQENSSFTDSEAKN